MFIGSSLKKRLPEVLAALENRSVLTVSDMMGFLRRGGMINFVIQEDTVRFDINLEAAQRAELKVSSQLLKVARAVKGSH